MSCDLLKWAASRKGLTTQQYALLVAMAAKSIDGAMVATKVELGAFVSLKERQTATVLNQLCELGLISKHRRGGNGRGRAANSYTLGAASTTAPVAESCRQSNAGNPMPAKLRNQQPAAGIEVLPAIIESPPMIYNSTPQELNPEPFELVSGIATPMAPKRKRAGQIGNLEFGPEFQEFAAKQGFLNGSGVALFERFRDYHQAKGSLMVNWLAAWRTWVNNEIQFRGAPNGERAHQSQRQQRPRSAVEAILSDIGRRPD